MTSDKAIVRPVRGKNSPHLSDCAVMAASEADLRMLCSKMNLQEANFTKLFMSRLYAADEGQTENFTIVGPFIGAAYAAMIMETLIAWGVRKILFLGWCGAVSPQVRIGDIIIPDCALIDEGTSMSYKKDKNICALPPGSLTESIKQALGKNDICFHTGSVWSTDAIYRETCEKMRYYQNKNALAVDMELSALFTVGSFRGVDVAGVLVVSDELSTGKQVPGFSSKCFKKSRVDVCEAITETFAKRPLLPNFGVRFNNNFEF